MSSAQTPLAVSPSRADERDALTAALLRLESLPGARQVDGDDEVTGLEQRAAALGAVDLVMRARLLHANTLARRGRTAAAARIARDVNRWATEAADGYVLARSHGQLALVMRALGDFGLSMEHAVHAVENTPPDAPRAVHVDHRLLLAIALARTGDFANAERRLVELAAELVQEGDETTLVSVLNNLAYMSHLDGQDGQARATAERMVRVAAEHDVPLQASHVDTYARVLLTDGEAATAAAFLAERVDEQDEGADPDAAADCLLTLAEAHRGLGEHDAAADALDRADRLCATRGLAEVAARVHQERSELLCAQGLYREALAEHQRFHAATAALWAAERDGRAKIAQAVFETAEARRESERLRDLSLHDPLTGLWNRRHVDALLPTLLEDAQRTGAPVGVAIVDLDHFKAVNDTFSHEVGDAVLVRTAALLADVVDEPAFAARLGGEEFLLVLPGHDLDATVARCELVRTALRTRTWSDVSPHLGRVTASFGVAVARPGATEQLELLRLADERLYAAKRAGRDRVVAG
ncbi:GGDEF domain-containing protein [Thalassiella azotivora]